jgi:hypothetical protein
MQSDLHDLNVFMLGLLAESYCRLFSAWRNDEEPTAGCYYFVFSHRFSFRVHRTYRQRDIAAA